jgi:hypothetical protein
MHCTVPYVLKGIAAPIALLLIVSCQSKRETASVVKILEHQELEWLIHLDLFSNGYFHGISCGKFNMALCT